MNNQYHTHISSKHNLFDLKLKEVWRYRDLILLFTKRSFIVQYKQTVLGPAWFLISPIISSLMYVFVFGSIAGIETDGVPRMLFYLGGNAIWSFFSNSLTGNAHTFTANAGMFGKVYFPRLTVPISNILSGVIKFCIHMITAVAFLFYYYYHGKVHPNWLAWTLIPIVLLHLGVMGMGLGIIISSLTTKYRDLSVLVGFGMQLWMYATPIIYPISQVSGLSRTVLLMNPVTAPIELFRYAFLGQGMVNIQYLAISWAFTLLVALLGVMIFNKVEKTFMDTV